MSNPYIVSSECSTAYENSIDTDADMNSITLGPSFYDRVANKAKLVTSHRGTAVETFKRGQIWSESSGRYTAHMNHLSRIKVHFNTLQKMQRDYILYRDELKIQIADCNSKIENDIFRKQNVDFNNKIRTNYNNVIETIYFKDLVDDQSTQTNKLLEPFDLLHASVQGRNAAEVIKNNENLKQNDTERINAAAEALYAKRHPHAPELKQEESDEEQSDHTKEEFREFLKKHRGKKD